MMSRRLVMRPQAVRDLDEQIAYFVVNASKAVAIRFAHMANETIEMIMEMPELGAPWESDAAKLQGLRYRMMKRFKRHVVFYRVTDEAIEIDRILRGSRNLEQYLLEIDEV